MSQTGSNPSPAAGIASGSILSGKVALVTGASSGIGAACGAALVRSGAHVILAARRGERLSALREQLHACGSMCHVLELDVRHAAAVTEGLASLPGELQAIDILINSAGLGRGLDKLHEGDPREWDEIIDTNVKGLLYVTRAVLPQMVARDTGHIVNIGSVAGRQAYQGGNVYAASKAAVRMLTECLKHDLGGTRVRVSTVDPGMVETEFSVVRFRGDRERADKVYDGMTPMSADDVAEAVLFCVTRPPHVNISEIVMLATDQSAAAVVHRRP
ncbi:MAG: SDR family NAD(P)-dependent oxidoreductase [Polyangia bacterium]